MGGGQPVVALAGDSELAGDFVAVTSFVGSSVARWRWRSSRLLRRGLLSSVTDCVEALVTTLVGSCLLCGSGHCVFSVGRGPSPRSRFASSRLVPPSTQQFLLGNRCGLCLVVPVHLRRSLVSSGPRLPRSPPCVVFFALAFSCIRISRFLLQNGGVDARATIFCTRCVFSSSQGTVLLTGVFTLVSSFVYSRPFPLWVAS